MFNLHDLMFIIAAPDFDVASRYSFEATIATLITIEGRDAREIEADVRLLRHCTPQTLAEKGLPLETADQLRKATCVLLRDLTHCPILPKRDFRVPTAWRLIADAAPSQAMTRFTRYCAMRALPIEDADGVLEGFRSDLTLVYDDYDSARASAVTVARALLRLRGTNPEYRIPVVKEPPRRTNTHSLESAKAEFRADYQLYNIMIQTPPAGPYVFDQTVRRRVLDNKSARVHMAHVRAAASAYVWGGGALTDLSGVYDLVLPDTLQRVKDGLKQSSLGKHYQSEVLHTLNDVARYWHRHDCAEVDKHRATAIVDNATTVYEASLSGSSYDTAANREATASFLNKAYVPKIMSAPRIIWQLAEEGHFDGRSEHRYRLGAAGLSFMTWAPALVSTVLDFDKASHCVVTPVGDWHITLPALAARHVIMHEIPAASAKLLVDFEAYRETITSGLPPSDRFFTGEDGGSITAATFSKAISDALEKATGLRLKPQQLRFFSAVRHYTLNPDDLETVRQILGYRDLKTTKLRLAQVRQIATSLKVQKSIIDSSGDVHFR